MKLVFLCNMDTIENVYAFAKEAHTNQVRKYVNEPYINHLQRVMETCKKISTSVPFLSAALLHDVLEDTHVTKGELKEFLAQVMSEENAVQTFEYVFELTDLYTKKNFPRLNRRNRKVRELNRLEKISAEAQTIKYADIIDNVKAIGAMDADFAPVYLWECRDILRRLTKGDEKLRNRAIEEVEREMQALHVIDSGNSAA